MWNLLSPLLTKKQAASILSQGRCPEHHVEHLFRPICLFCNGCWEHKLEVLDGLKTGYHTDDSDINELATIPGDKSGDDNAACIFYDGLFSDDVKGVVWVQCYKCGGWQHCKCAVIEKEVKIYDFCKYKMKRMLFLLHIITRL